MLTLEGLEAHAELQSPPEEIALERSSKPTEYVRGAHVEKLPHRNHKLLPQKVHANSLGALYYRSDYELRWLRVAKRCRVRWEKEFLKASDAGTVADMAVASKELREWCERERALLRIARPAAENIRKPKSAHRLDRDTTATVVETEPVPVPGPSSS